MTQIICTVMLTRTEF